MDNLLEITSKTEQQIARSSLEVLDKKGIPAKEVIEISIYNSKETVAIPFKAFLMLRRILSNMAQGKSIALFDSDTEVSTQQAAELLQVSRPHIVKLLETGKIPYRKVGSHRRIKAKDILRYEKELEQIRETALEALAKEAQELNLGYNL